MKKHIRYLSHILIHKWHAMIWCFRFGLYWRGIAHDMSKFRPSEWVPTVNRFYGNSLERKRAVKTHAYDYAVSLHYHRNSHHWQHHIRIGTKRRVFMFEMSREDTLEMVADWLAASYAKHGENRLGEWWDLNEEKILLNPTTANVVLGLVERWRNY